MASVEPVNVCVVKGFHLQLHGTDPTGAGLYRVHKAGSTFALCTLWIQSCSPSADCSGDTLHGHHETGTKLWNISPQRAGQNQELPWPSPFLIVSFFMMSTWFKITFRDAIGVRGLIYRPEARCTKFMQGALPSQPQPQPQQLASALAAPVSSGRISRKSFGCLV